MKALNEQISSTRFKVWASMPSQFCQPFYETTEDKAPEEMRTQVNRRVGPQGVGGQIQAEVEEELNNEET